MQNTGKKKTKASVVKRKRTTIRKYAHNAGIDETWLYPSDLDQEMSRSIVAYMTIRSAHRRGREDTRNDVIKRLGF